MRPKKTEYSRLNREEKGEGIHFDMPHGHTKMANGKSADEMSDDEIDLLLSLPDPPDSVVIARRR